MKTVTMVRLNGTVWYSWHEEDGCFTNHTAGKFLAFARKLQGSDFRNRFAGDPHRYTFWMESEIRAKHKNGEPLQFPVLYEDTVRIFELIVDGTDDFSLDHDFQLSLSPQYQWIWYLDLDNNMLSVYGGYKLLIDQTHHRNYDIKLELGCDGVPCYMVEFWMLDNLPDVQTLQNTCTEQLL